MWGEGQYFHTVCGGSISPGLKTGHLFVGCDFTLWFLYVVILHCVNVICLRRHPWLFTCELRIYCWAV